MNLLVKLIEVSLIVNTLIILPHLASVKDIFHFDMLYILGTQHGFSSDGEKLIFSNLV